MSAKAQILFLKERDWLLSKTMQIILRSNYLGVVMQVYKTKLLAQIVEYNFIWNAVVKGHRL